MTAAVKGNGSLEQIRGAFPALTRTHAGHPVAYFDGPGGTQVPRVVTDAVTDYLLNHNANTHWCYPTSVETDGMLNNSRAAFADFLNCGADEVAFGMNMTTLTFHVSRALGWSLQAGDEILVTDLDHHANVAPWRELEREQGIKLVSAPFDKATGELNMIELSRLITPRTRIVAIGAASNALGTINDLEEIMIMVRDVDALVYVDAVHSAAHQLPDVKELDCDFLVCSPYKFYGPHIGVMYMRKEIGERMRVPRLDPAPSDMPEKLETGTQNHEGMIGAAAAVDFLASFGKGATRRESLASSYDTLHKRGQRQIELMWEGLRGVNGVTVYGPSPKRPRTPTIAFTVAGRSSENVAKMLVDHGIFVSHGDFYATTVIEKLGLGADGVVRAGAACYTSDDEVERLVRGVAEIARAG